MRPYKNRGEAEQHKTNNKVAKQLAVASNEDFHFKSFPFPLILSFLFSMLQTHHCCQKGKHFNPLTPSIISDLKKKIRNFLFAANVANDFIIFLVSSLMLFT